jgi:hypothetical protein
MNHCIPNLSSRKTISTLLFCTVGLTTLCAAAQENNILLHSEHATDQSQIGVSIPMLAGDSGFVMAPKLDLQFRLGLASVGLHLPVVMTKPDGGEREFAVGNPALDVGAQTCLGSGLSLCVGGRVGVSAGFWSLDPTADAAKLHALALGGLAHHDPFYYSPENMAFQPKAFVLLSNGLFSAQAEAGTLVTVPLLDREGRETEVSLVYQAGVGVNLFDLVTPVVEFRGISTLTQDDNQNQFWASAGARFHLSSFQPYARVSLPLNENAKQDLPWQFDLGAAVQF